MAIKQGSLVKVARQTHAGQETILGRVTMGLIEGGKMTHVTVEGTVQHTKIGTTVIPSERSVTLEMIEVEPTPFTKVELVK